MVGGRDCRCGSLGHLEAYVGAGAILERYGLPLPGDDEESALAALIDLAETSPEAAKVLDETALYLGAGIGNLINLFSPDRIILGGWAGVLLGHHMLPAIRSSARGHALSHPFAETTIIVGRLGPGRGRAWGGHAARFGPSSTAARSRRREGPPRPKRSAPPAPATSAEAGGRAGPQSLPATAGAHSSPVRRRPDGGHAVESRGRGAGGEDERLAHPAITAPSAGPGGTAPPDGITPPVQPGGTAPPTAPTQADR